MLRGESEIELGAYAGDDGSEEEDGAQELVDAVRHVEIQPQSQSAPPLSGTDLSQNGLSQALQSWSSAL